MNDTEILNWIEENATKLGMKADFAGWNSEEKWITLDEPDLQFTDIRKKVMELAKE